MEKWQHFDLPDDHREVLETIVRIYLETGAWPTYGYVEDECYRKGQVAEEILGALPFGLVRPDNRAFSGMTWRSPTEELKVGFRGLMACRDSDDLVERFLLILEQAVNARLSLSHPSPQELSEAVWEFSDAIAASRRTQDDEVTVNEVALLLEIMRDEPHMPTWSGPVATPMEWSISIPREIRRYKEVADAFQLARNLEPGTPLPKEHDHGAQMAPSLEDDVRLAGAEYDFDVALSFAGEDRNYVQQVAVALMERGIRVFYDQDHAAEMWGEDLGDFLDDVYRRRSRFVVAFLSIHYVAKAWPSHERKSAFARALESDSPYVLPIRLDDTEVPGLRPTTGWIDSRKASVPEIVAAVEVKLAGKPAQGPPLSWQGTVPRTRADLDLLLLSRPSGWEFLLFGGCLYLGLLDLEAEYRDFELGYAAPTHRVVSRDEVSSFLSSRIAEVDRIVGQTERIFQESAQEKAFGKPGEPGDPELIQHLASRIISLYKDLLDWTSEMRGTVFPEQFRGVASLVARFTENPVVEFREFVRMSVESLDELPAYLARPEPKEPYMLTMQLVLTMDETVLRMFHKEMKRLRRRL